MFPFDQQNCELTFKMRNAIKAQVIKYNSLFVLIIVFIIGVKVLIVPGNIVYKGAKSVVEFIVNNYTMVDAGGNRDTKKVTQLHLTDPLFQLVVHFIRQPNYYITSCFIPTFMLGTLAYFTFFIHIDDFNDRCRSCNICFCFFFFWSCSCSCCLHSPSSSPQVHGLPDRPAGARLHDARVHGGTPQGLIHQGAI